MRLVDDLLESVARFDCPVKRVCVGLHWTVVDSRFTGIAHTYKTNRKVELESSGNLLEESALELASRLRSWDPLESSLGLAALNSLIDPMGRPLNVFTHILSIARGKTVTVVGRFPANDQIAEAAGRVYLLETDPEAGELPCWASEEVIPASDIVVITAAALINKSLPRLLELSRRATTIVVGPSAPMNTVLFRHGADIVAGVRVTSPDALISSVMQGAKQFKRLAGLEPIVQMPAGQ